MDVTLDVMMCSAFVRNENDIGLNDIMVFVRYDVEWSDIGVLLLSVLPGEYF